MATLSAASRRNSNASSTSGSPRPSLSGGVVSRMSSLNEEDQPDHLPSMSENLSVSSSSECYSTNNNNSAAKQHVANVNGYNAKDCSACNETGKANRMRICSERSDSGISDCSSITTSASQIHQSNCPIKPLLNKKYSITEEDDDNLEKISSIRMLEANGSETKRNNIKSIYPQSVQKVPVKSKFETVKDRTGSAFSIRTRLPDDRFSVNGVSRSQVKPGQVGTNMSSYSFVDKCSRKADGLMQQTSVDSGVHVDIATPSAPGKVSKIKSELSSWQRELGSFSKVLPKDLPLNTNQVLSTTSVLQTATKLKTSPKTPTVPKSSEQSANYQKAVAFWKR